MIDLDTDHQWRLEFLEEVLVENCIFAFYKQSRYTLQAS